MAVVGRQADARADLYALGVMSFEMLTGQRPYDAKNPIAMLRAHASEVIPSAARRRPGLPPGVDAFMAVALAKDPEERFQNAEALAAALGAALGDRRAG